MTAVIEEYARMVEENTGRTIEGWERAQSQALMRDVDAGIVRSGKVLTTDAMVLWMRRYGFDPDDFEATFLPDSDGRRHVEFRLVPGRFPF